ncbi:hypothetical protein FACS1894108_12320 [Planctomycetales bacterium]|nr:hypothetical protein FACS1894108_12320 [Planctomycetales bacterium]
MPTNRKYKDGLFTTIFNQPKYACELYNALSDAHAKPADITINTLDNVLYDGLRNDVSFIAEKKLLVFSEQQSTPNPNMPLRFFLYAAEEYKRLVGDDRQIYSQRLIDLPRPEFFVFYNGWQDAPERCKLNLSEAFVKLGGKKPSPLNLTVNFYNINYGHNAELLNKSRTLKDYARFVERSRPKRKGEKMTDSKMREVIDYCVAHDILKPILSNLSQEGVKMLTTTFDLEAAKRVWRDDWREEGREEGHKNGFKKGREKERFEIAQNMKKLGVSNDIIIKSTGIQPKMLACL